MKAFLLGAVVGVAALVAAVYFYFSLGYAPAATAAPPMPFEKQLARMALHARIDKEMPKTVPVAANQDTYAAGADIYRTHCAVCHGLPDQPASAIGKGMFPKVPQLFKHGVTDDPPGVTYWKVENGIRLTGMPAYVKSLSEEQIWQVTLLLANADKVSPEVEAKLKAPLVVQ